MKFQRLEDLQIWCKAQELGVRVYKYFGLCRDFGFRDQIQRAAISISNNIAEGFERHGKIEFRRFLFIAKGSCGEVLSMVYIGHKLGYISEREKAELSLELSTLGKMLGAFIKTLS